MCLHNRFLGLNIKTGSLNGDLEQITLSSEISFHYRGCVLAFEIRSGTLPCLLLLPSIYTDLFPSLTQNTFSVWLSIVQMWNSWMFLNMVWLYFFFFKDTAVKLMQPLTRMVGNGMCQWLKVRVCCSVRRSCVNCESQSTGVALEF